MTAVLDVYDTLNSHTKGFAYHGPIDMETHVMHELYDEHHIVFQGFDVDSVPRFETKDEIKFWNNREY